MADQQQGDDTNHRKGGNGRRVASTHEPTAPCGACKFLRRKCIPGCIFAPHFASEQGAARFAAVHKVFGASNVSKLLLHIPLNHRHDAVVTISYEAQARLSDPVYGCVSTILTLQQQVASLQAELAAVQTQLLSNRFAIANALQHQHHPTQQQQILPTYANNTNFNANFDHLTTPSSLHSLEQFKFSRSCQDEDEDEEECHNPIIFTNDLFHRR